MRTFPTVQSEENGGRGSYKVSEGRGVNRYAQQLQTSLWPTDWTLSLKWPLSNVQEN